MRTLSKKVVLLLATFLILSCNSKNSEYQEPAAEEEVAMSKEDMIKRGEYLALIIGCDHCHTPKKMTEHGPVPDIDRWYMGFPATDSLATINKDELGPGKWMMFNNDLTAFVGPWGVSFGANITSDATGIGNWSFEQFKKAMTEGKYKGMDNSRPIMPPMPWESFKLMKEDDLRAVYEYLQSTKPIENVVPSYIPPPAM